MESEIDQLRKKVESREKRVDDCAARLRTLTRFGDINSQAVSKSFKVVGSDVCRNGLGRKSGRGRVGGM